MTTKLGPGGFAVAVRDLISAWLGDSTWAGVMNERLKSALETARDACADHAGEPQPAEDADALLLACIVLADAADDLATPLLDVEGAISSIVAGAVWDARELLEESNEDEDEDDDDPCL